MSKSERFTVNNSTGKPNYSQRLNADDPSTPWNETMETCNVTAAITAMVTAGHSVEKLNRGLHPRPPMDLLLFMRQDKQCLSTYRWVDPQQKTPMNEWMDVLTVAISEYLRLPSVARVYAANRMNIYEHLHQGGGAVIHGNYTFTRADGTKVKSGHYQSLAGYSVPFGEVEIDQWIVDDPFGDPRTEYVSRMGDNVILTIDEVDRLVKPIGKGGKDVILIPRAAL